MEALGGSHAALEGLHALSVSPYLHHDLRSLGADQHEHGLTIVCQEPLILRRGRGVAAP